MTRQLHCSAPDVMSRANLPQQSGNNCNNNKQMSAFFSHRIHNSAVHHASVCIFYFLAPTYLFKMQNNAASVLNIKIIAKSNSSLLLRNERNIYEGHTTTTTALRFRLIKKLLECKFSCYRFRLLCQTNLFSQHVSRLHCLFLSYTVRFLIIVIYSLCTICFIMQAHQLL